MTQNHEPSGRDLESRDESEDDDPLYSELVRIRRRGFPKRQGRPGTSDPLALPELTRIASIVSPNVADETERLRETLHKAANRLKGDDYSEATCDLWGLGKTSAWSLARRRQKAAERLKVPEASFDRDYRKPITKDLAAQLRVLYEEASSQGLDDSPNPTRERGVIPPGREWKIRPQFLIGGACLLLLIGAVTVALAVRGNQRAQEPTVPIGGWGPNRPVFDYRKIKSACTHPKHTFSPDFKPCGSFSGPVFNSFINTPHYGDERAFLDARRNSRDPRNLLSEVTKGDRLVRLRLYIDNNADPILNDSGKGVARNTQVRVDLPDSVTKGYVVKITAFISADNATPKVVKDTVDLTASEKFSLSYIPGSATLFNARFENGTRISDSIVTTGTKVGFYSVWDGNFPGGFHYQATIDLLVSINI